MLRLPTRAVPFRQPMRAMIRLPMRAMPLRLPRLIAAVLVAAIASAAGASPPVMLEEFTSPELREAVFEQVLEHAARSFKLHGFRDVVFLGDPRQSSAELGELGAAAIVKTTIAAIDRAVGRR